MSRERLVTASCGVFNICFQETFETIVMIIPFGYCNIADMSLSGILDGNQYLAPIKNGKSIPCPVVEFIRINTLSRSGQYLAPSKFIRINTSTRYQFPKI